MDLETCWKHPVLRQQYPYGLQGDEAFEELARIGSYQVEVLAPRNGRAQQFMVTVALGPRRDPVQEIVQYGTSIRSAVMSALLAALIELEIDGVRGSEEIAAWLNEAPETPDSPAAPPGA